MSKIRSIDKIMFKNKSYQYNSLIIIKIDFDLIRMSENIVSLMSRKEHWSSYSYL
jgi:hypothetical protein